MHRVSIWQIIGEGLPDTREKEKEDPVLENAALGD